MGHQPQFFRDKRRKPDWKQSSQDLNQQPSTRCGHCNRWLNLLCYSIHFTPYPYFFFKVYLFERQSDEGGKDGGIERKRAIICSLFHFPHGCNRPGQSQEFHHFAPRVAEAQGSWSSSAAFPETLAGIQNGNGITGIQTCTPI